MFIKIFFHITFYAFIENQIIKSVKIGENIQTIGHWAFWKCFSLETLYIPNSTLTIKNGAFYKTNLTTIYYNGTVADKNKILITNSYNDLLFESNWIYNSESDWTNDY